MNNAIFVFLLHFVCIHFFVFWFAIRKRRKQQKKKHTNACCFQTLCVLAITNWKLASCSNKITTENNNNNNKYRKMTERRTINHTIQQQKKSSLYPYSTYTFVYMFHLFGKCAYIQPCLCVCVCVCVCCRYACCNGCTAQ